MVDQTAASPAESLWSEVSDQLRGLLSDTAYTTWFSEVTGHELTADTFVLAVPNDFTRAWIDGHFHGLVAAAVRRAHDHELAVELRVLAPQVQVPTADEAAATSDGQASTVAPAARRVHAGSGGRAINAKSTFDTFVIGPSNRFAHAAALAVAEAPAQAYNPLFIHGATGLGKTHLLQAIAQYVSEHLQHLSVRYLTSESFLNDFINSLRDKRIEGFKQRYRTCDLLLIDDIQFFEQKERIQEEFFHTFNSLYEAGSQIVISSDRPPRDVATLEDRLRGRFEWGLITGLQPPDLETRIAILRKKVRLDGTHIHDEQVLTLIASRVSTNIRELEGALTRVIAFSSLMGERMTLELAEEVLGDVSPQGEDAQVSIRRIQDLVAERFSLSLDELCGDRRSRNIVYPRQVAMYLSRELTDSSLPMIGREFGGRDHTTVIHANSKIARLVHEDRSVHDLVQDLIARLPQRDPRDSPIARRRTPPRRG
jgi:chromosomal replication initiator protein